MSAWTEAGLTISGMVAVAMSLALLKLRSKTTVKRPYVVKIERWSLIEGIPEHVFCECGAQCRCISHAWRREGKIHTEWFCPNCVKSPV